MSAPANEIGCLDATAQAALVASNDVKPRELVEWAIERAEALNPTLNAIVIPMYDRARDGEGGVPMLLKDLIVEVPGVEIANGSRFVAGTISTFESELVTRLRRGGFAFVGKTNSPEFGMAVHCEPALRGATHNPWSLEHTTAGSSGGSASAVAAGIVPVAHASDAGGSIRYPASCCGLFGLKPTRARNPVGPEYGDALVGLGVEHVVTRSVRDSARVLDVTSGPAPGDPYWAPPPTRPFADEVGVDPGRLRIAYSRTSAEHTKIDADCLAALDATLRLLDDLGHVVVEHPFTEIDERTGAAISTFMPGLVAWMVGYWTRRLGRGPRPGELEPGTAAMLDASNQVSAGEFLLARDDINAYARRAAAWFDDFDLFLCPTVTTPPLRIGEVAERGADMIRNAGIIANLTGNPAMSVPLFWNADGLPIGSHFLAPFGDEAALFRLAAQLEAAQPWADRWPSVSVAN